MRLAQELSTSRGELQSIQGSRLWKAANLYWRARRLAARLSRPARRILNRWSGSAPSDWVGPDVAHRAAAAALPAAIENRHEVVLFARGGTDTNGSGISALAQRLASEGHRVFSVSPHFRSEGAPYESQRRNGNLFEVSLLARGADPTGPTDALFGAVDALRRDECLGATLALVEDPSWMPLAKRLRRERGWPLLDEASSDRSPAQAFPKLSVVVVTYDNRDLNRMCLDSVIARTEWPNLEIVVVDNGSTDGTREWLREEETRLAPRLRVIANAAESGLARIRRPHSWRRPRETIS